MYFDAELVQLAKDVELSSSCFDDLVLVNMYLHVWMRDSSHIIRIAILPILLDVRGPGC